MHVHLSVTLQLEAGENTSVVQVMFHFMILFSEGKLALITWSLFGEPPTKLWDLGHDVEVISLADFDLWPLWQSTGMMIRGPGLTLEDCRA